MTDDQQHADVLVNTFDSDKLVEKGKPYIAYGNMGMVNVKNWIPQFAFAGPTWERYEGVFLANVKQDNAIKPLTITKSTSTPLQVLTLRNYLKPQKFLQPLVIKKTSSKRAGGQVTMLQKERSWPSLIRKTKRILLFFQLSNQWRSFAAAIPFAGQFNF
ncbi:hypothetical protein ACWGXJ_03290 [Paenibacillus sp. S33]